MLAMGKEVEEDDDDDEVLTGQVSGRR